MNISSILDGLYEEVKNKILASVPEVKHFDLFADQYDKYPQDQEGNPLDHNFNRPAVFFEWPDLNIEPLGMRRKKTNVEFALHIVQDVVQEVDSRTPNAVRQKGHSHTALLNKIDVAIEGFRGDQAVDFKHFGSISWVGLKPYTLIGNQTVHIVAFKTRVVIDAATKFYTKLSDLTPPVEAVDEITGQIEEL